MLFLHGIAATCDSWSTVRAELEHDHDTDAYDHRGHGASPHHGPADLTVTQLAADLNATLDALNSAEPVVLVGHSLGGMTIMAYAANHPEHFRSRVAAVVLVSTTAGNFDLGCGLPGPLGSLVARSFRTVAAVIAAPPSGPLGPIVSRTAKFVLRTLTTSRWPLYSWSTPASIRRDCSAGIAATPPQSLHTLLPQLAAHRARDLTPLHEVPVLILVGTEDRLSPPAHSRDLRKLLPQADLHLIPRAGHVLPLEQPHAVAAHIRRLLSA
ncbi:alpha/beta fold hydrolase [Nocardia sp. NPDC056100]|uniref:alpha/beta fold hydrolase n=1 Tax=Nocardia sp. NPDC056100 TaxID=3345712 RepID=UPI0035DAA07A